jgi:CheY-like chemotaxis protein
MSVPDRPRSSATTPPTAFDDGCKRRILVIDDNVAIHRDFRKILCPEPVTRDLDALDEAIFGSGGAPSTRGPKREFIVDAASQGQEGLEAVMRMQRLGRPYALTFVDMRMPPGWDGIETLEKIWAVCPDIEAVICSAYSEYSWNDVIKRLNRPGLRLLSKPFASKDVLEFAWSLTSRWLSRHGGGQ